MTQRVLITGAGGFVGHHFFEHVLTKTDWDVVITDSFRHKGKTDRIREVLYGQPDWTFPTSWHGRTQIVTHDLTVPFSTQALDLIRNVDHIVAFASESHVDRSITDPVPFVRNNVDIALTSLELARKLEPKSFSWISTDEVYGPVAADDLTGHPEWDTILPSNPYAGSKAAQEALAISYWRTYGVPLILFNCMNMIGERQDLEKFIPMVTSRVSRGEEVVIHGTPGNIGTRHYLHARNLADAILFAIRKQHPAIFPAHAPAYDLRTAELPDRYNVASPDRIDNLTLAQMIAEDVGKPLRYRLEDFHTTRPGHDPHYGLDSSKLHELGWRMPRSFRESLRKTIKWTLANPSWLIPD